MPRIKYVKKAQQRYGTKPVLDPATGEQVKVPLKSKRTGEQLKDKHGNLRWQRQSVRDLDKPLPMPKCDFCHEAIAVGEAYAIAPLRYGKRYRHTAKGHPTWQPWDLSSSMSARVMQAVDGAEKELDALGEFEETDDVSGVLESLAEEIRGLASEREESAQNIVDGFGHDTYQSEELQQNADDLNAWADEIEEALSSADEPPDPEAVEYAGGDCEECDGTGEVDNPEYDEDDEDSDEEETVDCDNCGGTGEVDPEESLEDAWSDWREAVLDAAREVMQNSPL